MNKLNIVLFLFLVAMIFAKIAADPYLTGWGIVGQWLVSLNFVAIFSLLLFTVLYLMRLAANSQSVKRKLIIFFFALVISTGFVFQIHFQADDETVLAYLAYHATASGLNPYAQNFSSQLLPALAIYRAGPTYTLNGSIIADYQYPALYMLVQAPFFALLNPAPSTLNIWVMPFEYSFFFIFFLLACYWLAKEKQNQLPVYSGIVLASIVFYVFSSVAILLMLTLILLMFTESGKRYSWLILGLMASLQQQLWILVLLFLAYDFVKDSGKAIRTALGAGLVFLLINGYFILLNPSGFFGSFLSFSGLLPNMVAPLAALLQIAGIAPNLLFLLFVLSTLIVIAIALKLQEKRFLVLLSAVPYLFMAHSLPVYFALPFAAWGLIQD